MGSLFTVNNYQTWDGSHLEKKLDSIIKLLHNMPTKAEFDAAFAEVSASFDNIAADITRLTDQLQTGDLTPAEETEVFAQLRAVADRAKQLSEVTPEPPQA